jgi:broad specificity phosphatase PhoE
MPIQSTDRIFYFVRHGITEANLQRRWCGGDWDIQLHSKGELQANALADRLFECRNQYDHIFSSPMVRAQQTTQIINAKASKPVSIIEDLREWRIGELENTPWAEPLLGKAVSDWPTPVGGESVSSFRARIASALTYCLDSSQRPLLVSHGAVGRILLDLLSIPHRDITNCVLFKFVSF